MVNFLGNGDNETGKSVLKRILDDAAESGHAPALNLVAPNGEWIGGESTGDVAADAKLLNHTPAVYDSNGKVVQKPVAYVDLNEIGKQVGIQGVRPVRGWGVVG